MKKWIAFIVFIFPLWAAWSSAVDQMVPAEFLEQLKNEKTVSVRFRQNSGLEQKTMKLDEFIAYVQEKTDSHSTTI